MSQIHQEFDQFAQQYRPDLDKALSISGESSSYFAQLKVNKLAQWLPQLANQEAKILDFGCGDGLMTSFLKQQFPRSTVFGVDPSPKSIEIAQKNYPEVSFAVNSDTSTTVEFPDELFDVVCAAGAFHHIPFSMHEGYMNEINRILKKNGTFVLFELNPFNPLTVITFKRNPIDRNARMLWPWYAYRLNSPYGKTRIKFYCFFPNRLRQLRFTEPLLTKVPFGALYAIVMNKK
jgi:SAM-dependent methyltransferase